MRPLIKAPEISRHRSDLRPLNAPSPLRVQTDAEGRIVSIWRQGRLTPRTIAAIQDHWRIDDEWWREHRVARMYYDVVLDDGTLLTIYQERMAALTREELRHLVHFVPDFPVEVRSESQRLRRLKAKMEEWIANGVRLAWLLDEKNKTAYIYRSGAEVQVIENPATLDGSPELPGFVLDLAKIWS